MPFASILYSNGREPEELSETPPDGFDDLGLDAVVASLRRSREEFGIERIWYSPPSRIEDALYRQQVFEDLENEDVLSSLREFEEAFGRVLAFLKQAEDTSGHQREGIFLGAVLLYIATVQKMLDSLSNPPPSNLKASQSSASTSRNTPHPRSSLALSPRPREYQQRYHL